MTDIKQERRKLGSRYLDGVLMYPGEYLFTWLRMGATWHLVSMEPIEP